MLNLNKMQIAEQSAQRSLNFQMTDESINLSGGARRAVAEVAAEIRCLTVELGSWAGLLSSEFQRLSEIPPPS